MGIFFLSLNLIDAGLVLKTAAESVLSTWRKSSADWFPPPHSVADPGF